MDMIELFKAYEIFKTHGFDLIRIDLIHKTLSREGDTTEKENGNNDGVLLNGKPNRMTREVYS